MNTREKLLEFIAKNKVEDLSNLEKTKLDLISNKDIINDFLNNLQKYGKTTITPGQKDSDIRFIYKQVIQNDLFKNRANIGILSQQLLETENERQELLDSGLNPSFQGVIDLDQKIVGIQKDILKEVKAIIKETEQEIVCDG